MFLYYSLLYCVLRSFRGAVICYSHLSYHGLSIEFCELQTTQHPQKKTINHFSTHLHFSASRLLNSSEVYHDALCFWWEIYCFSARTTRLFFLTLVCSLSTMRRLNRRFHLQPVAQIAEHPDYGKSRGVTNLFIDPLRHKFIHLWRAAQGFPFSVLLFYHYASTCI